MNRVTAYLLQRSRLVGVVALLGGMSALLTSPVESHDEAGLKAALVDAGPFLVGRIAWEPSRGLLGDLTIGRPLLFEAAAPSDPLERQDIYRTFVRVSPEGKVLDVGTPVNLTGTRRGHESDLATRGPIAAFVTRDKDVAPSVTFLDLRGDRNRSGLSWAERSRLAVTRYLNTGSWRGLGRTDLFVDDAELDLELTSTQVIASTSKSSSTWTYGELFSPEPPPTDPGAQLVPRLLTPSPFLHWAANTGRHFVGTGPIAWAEGRAFSLWDRLHQASYHVVSSETTSRNPLPIGKKPSTRSAADLGVWPPKPIELNGRKEGDGIWRPIRSPLHPVTDPPLFYRTVIHSDPARPYAELHLVAMDMRRLELRVAPGYEDPHPDTGPPGSGQIPDEPTIYKNVVATFNGAFKADHGNYGMKAEGRLLVEPVVGAATVAIDRSGSAGFGTWTKEHEAAELLAFRQNLDPLVHQGKVNPAGRKVWGDHLYGAGVAVERSALCLHESGQLLYGWALEATGHSLAEGMALAGCSFAIHLDMNPGHCAFAFNRIASIAPLVAEGEVLDKRMKVNATRFVRWSPKDFFYVMRRTPVPEVGNIEWKPAPGEMPPPESLPGLFVGSKSVGGLNIEFDRIDADRLRFEVGIGTAENPRKKAPPVEGGALIAWGLGHGTHGNRPGLTHGTDIIVPLDRSFASLVLENGKPTLLPPAEPQAERDQTTIIQFPVLAREGKLTERAQELGGKRLRAALCIDPHGNLYVARMTHDTPAPLAQSLVDVGCRLVIELDRGSRPPPLVQRADTDSPPHSGYEQSMLYGTATQMLPHTHEF